MECSPNEFREAGHLCEPTASREAAQLWDGCMSALLYGSAKRDLFILAAVD